jgi:hypothetical protein
VERRNRSRVSGLRSQDNVDLVSNLWTITRGFGRYSEVDWPFRPLALAKWENLLAGNDCSVVPLRGTLLVQSGKVNFSGSQASAPLRQESFLSQVGIGYDCDCEYFGADLDLDQKGETIMDTQPTHEQARLQLELFEMRREARLRQAREWFQKNYFIDSF